MADDGKSLSIGARQLQELREAAAAPSTAPSGPATGEHPPGWWQASDGQWYPPETHPSIVPAGATAPSTGGGLALKIVGGVIVGFVALVVVLILAVTLLGKRAVRTSTAASRAGFVAGAADGFAARFPTEPKRSEQTVPFPGGQATVVLYDSVTSDEEVGVSLTRMPSTPDPSVVQRVLDGAANGGAAKTGTNVVSRTMSTFQGAIAEDALLTKAGAAIRVRVFIVGARLFTVTSVTRTPTDAHPGYDRALSTFSLL